MVKMPKNAINSKKCLKWLKMTQNSKKWQKRQKILIFQKMRKNSKIPENA
jgi:hypothetical protein